MQYTGSAAGSLSQTLGTDLPLSQSDEPLPQTRMHATLATTTTLTATGTELVTLPSPRLPLWE